MDLSSLTAGSPSDLLSPREVAALFPGPGGRDVVGFRMVYRWISRGKVVRGQREPIRLRGTQTPTGIFVQRGHLVEWLVSLQRAREAVLRQRLGEQQQRGVPSKPSRMGLALAGAGTA